MESIFFSIPGNTPSGLCLESAYHGSLFWLTYLNRHHLSPGKRWPSSWYIFLHSICHYLAYHIFSFIFWLLSVFLTWKKKHFREQGVLFTAVSPKQCSINTSLKWICTFIKQINGKHYLIYFRIKSKNSPKIVLLQISVHL